MYYYISHFADKESKAQLVKYKAVLQSSLLLEFTLLFTMI